MFYMLRKISSLNIFANFSMNFFFTYKFLRDCGTLVVQTSCSRAGSKAAFDQTSRNKSWHIEPPLSMCRLEIAPYLLSPARLHITSQPAGADLANSQKFVYRWQHLLSKTSFDSTLHRNINCQKYKVKINVRFKY